MDNYKVIDVSTNPIDMLEGIEIKTILHFSKTKYFLQTT